MQIDPAATSRESELREAISRGAPLLLDGATGTELERRGIDASLPLWSARALLDAPEVVRDIHARYVDAGARLLTANSFRTQRRTLASAGIGERCFELTALAVRLALEAADAGEATVWVAGSAPPLEDCYHPERTPPEPELGREHAEHARALERAGADCILVETMNCIREARAAAEAAAQTQLPVLVSFVSWEGGRLLSGEPLDEAFDAVAQYEPVALLVNCLPVSALPDALRELRVRPEAFGVYPNLGGPVAGAEGLRSEHQTPSEFARQAAEWARLGARIVGGCCGTTPAHTEEMARALAAASPE